MNNPWKTLKSELKYENPWIAVTEHQVLDAGENDGIYGTVHFKNIAIGIIPLDEENNTWLVGQYRYPLNQYSWEICEGGGKLGIPPLESAQRELLEETGIKANQWKKILDMHLSNSVSDEVGIIYLAKDLAYFEPQPDEDEVLQLKKISFDEAFEMVMNGTITDSLSVAGILKTKILLDKGII
ncbi:MAG: DNA mismatch repair protein MutT [Flavobacteriales bacterium CG18_big_fil_WC_8_21_14_2_50_32_9]|nr:NUDIX hydrolase [Flavobacteriales bacterium]PIQ16778.1 MAG: DNA mismatch repair protein MutT [Flavobacteriales bacterium CG18_big_fil_WC_8_21_14_2_50_32_9]PJC63261.1 MAG: DNA mismatch repair protein MutT [Flavobacteriales bacterium CG_4_9_14_0_2_um_filter_32_27]